MNRVTNALYRKVAIYGRVSTEHEAQLSAFENQQAWYEGIAQQHNDWVIVDRYYDEGITGTAAQKRPAFMQMLQDAHKGKFDLIVTREVCRFARNTVDTLTVTRELSRLGIEVYFIQDNIWTMDGDGELRLTIMATLAQEESRKISERVRAGQQISREKGVLYGTGNILGYDRSNGTYVINPEQAYTVRKIYELYASGKGYKSICSDLTRLGCKNAHGQVEWSVDRVGRILKNATYKGSICYNKSHSDGYLTQKRINHRDEDYVYVKGDFEPIVSETLWQRCAELRMKKSTKQLGSDGRMRKFGRQEPISVWSSKLRCSCGSSFRRFLWHQNENGRKTYGYECYRQKRYASNQYLKAHGLDASKMCQSKSIPSWHIDLMAQMVFKAVWQDRKEAVLLACQIIEECAIQEVNNYSSMLEQMNRQIETLKKQQEGLRRMRALEDISREEFLSDNKKLQEEIDALQIQISEQQSSCTSEATTGIDFEKIRTTLNQWIDFSRPTIADALIEQFIRQVVVIDDNTFNWTLDLTHKTVPDQTFHMVPDIDIMLSNHVADPQELLSLTITKDDAAAYCKSIGMKFFAKKWNDKTVIISI